MLKFIKKICVKWEYLFVNPNTYKSAKLMLFANETQIQNCGNYVLTD